MANEKEERQCWMNDAINECEDTCGALQMKFYRNFQCARNQFNHPACIRARTRCTKWTGCCILAQLLTVLNIVFIVDVNQTYERRLMVIPSVYTFDDWRTSGKSIDNNREQFHGPNTFLWSHRKLISLLKIIWLLLWRSSKKCATKPKKCESDRNACVSATLNGFFRAVHLSTCA